jgi:hypothetical protein
VCRRRGFERLVDFLTNGGLRNRVSSEIGQFVACFASLEFEVDDLLGLANSRIDMIAVGVRKYPVQMSQKVEALAPIASAVGHVWDQIEFERKFAQVGEIRQLLVHGRIASVKLMRGGYIVDLVKMTLPKKIDGQQILTRKSSSVDSMDLWDCLMKIHEMETHIEGLRVAVFRSAEGWPSYLAMPAAKPFAAGVVMAHVSRNRDETTD